LKKSTALYVAQLKLAMGDALMSDRELGERLGYSQQFIAKAKGGNMSDPFAIKIEDMLRLEPGEVLTVARAERERTPEVKERLLSWATKTLALMPSKASSASALASGVRAIRNEWRKRSFASSLPPLTP
jgi:hypothetical protein